MRTRSLARMSWTEARDVLRTDPVALIPLGTVEQHGPHLPMTADTIVAEAVAAGAAESSNSIVVPAINFGYCATSENFPGTVSWPSSLLAEVLERTVEGLADHGVRRFVFVNNHRSNAAAAQQSAYALRKRRKLLIGSFFPWGTMIAIARKEFPELSGAIGHGGEPETSVMLHLCPEDVLDVDQQTERGYANFQGLPMKSAVATTVDGYEVNLYRDLEELTASGVNGDPRRGDPALGAELLKRTTAVLTSLVEQVSRLDIEKG